MCQYLLEILLHASYSMRHLRLLAIWDAEVCSYLLHNIIYFININSSLSVMNQSVVQVVVPTF